MVGGKSVSAAAADTLSRGEAGAAPPPWTPPGAPGGARGAAGGVAGLPQDFCRHLDDRILIDLRIKIRMGSHHGFFFGSWMPVRAQEKCLGFQNAPLRGNGDFLNCHGSPMPAPQGRNTPGLPKFSHQDPNGFPSWIFCDSWVPVGAQEKCLGSHNAPLRGNGDFLNFHGSPMPAPQGRNTRGLPPGHSDGLSLRPTAGPQRAPPALQSSPGALQSSPELSRALQARATAMVGVRARVGSHHGFFFDSWVPVWAQEKCLGFQNAPLRGNGDFLNFHGSPMPAPQGRNTPGLPPFSHQDPNGFPSWIFLRFRGARLGTRTMFGIPKRAIARQRYFSEVPRISNAGPAGP